MPPQLRTMLMSMSSKNGPESCGPATSCKATPENLKATKDGSLRFNEKSGLVDDSVMNKKLRDFFGEWNFSDLKIPIKVVATDLLAGEKVILSDGSVFDAIRASIAIPIIFPPWEVDGRLLVDGTASDPLPIDVAIQDGADIIIAMGFPLHYRCAGTTEQHLYQ